MKQDHHKQSLASARGSFMKMNQALPGQTHLNAEQPSQSYSSQQQGSLAQISNLQPYSYHHSDAIDHLPPDGQLDHANSPYLLSGNNASEYGPARSMPGGVESSNDPAFHAATSQAHFGVAESGALPTNPPPEPASSLTFGFPPTHFTSYNTPTTFPPLSAMITQPGFRPQVPDEQNQLSTIYRSPHSAQALSPNTVARDNYFHYPPHTQLAGAQGGFAYQDSPHQSSPINYLPASPQSGYYSPSGYMRNGGGMPPQGHGTTKEEAAGFPFGPIHHENLLTTNSGAELHPNILYKIDKGFFLCPADGTWTCYRRNYFGVHTWYELPGDFADQQLYVGSNPVKALGMRICATIDGSAGKTIQLIGHTPKRDQGPKIFMGVHKILPVLPSAITHRNLYYPQAPYPIAHSNTISPFLPLQDEEEPLMFVEDTKSKAKGAKDYESLKEKFQSANHHPYSQQPAPYGRGTSTHFERVQFKAATANNGKRRATQQYFHLMVEVVADVRKRDQDSSRWIRLCHRVSEKVIVRGRSPSHYKGESQSKSNGRGGSTSGYGGPPDGYPGSPSMDGGYGGTYGNGYGSSSGHVGGQFPQGSFNPGGFRGVGNYPFNHQAGSPPITDSSSTGTPENDDLGVGNNMDAKPQLLANVSNGADHEMSDKDCYIYDPRPMYEPNSRQKASVAQHTLPPFASKFAVQEEYPDAVAGSAWSDGSIRRAHAVDSSKGLYPVELHSA